MSGSTTDPATAVGVNTTRTRNDPARITSFETDVIPLSDEARQQIGLACRRPHPSTYVLSKKDLQRISHLAKAIEEFLCEAREECHFFSCEVLFVSSRGMRKICDEDLFGVRSHFLVEDATHEEMGYADYTHWLYKMLQVY